MSNAITVKALRKVVSSDFTVDGPLGAGGQGTVFLGTYKTQKVALKVFDPRSDPRRIARELKALGDIDCPNLVKVIASTTVKLGGADLILVAYAYHPGGNLVDHLKPHAPQTTAGQLKRIGTEISTALEALWQKRVVHRDVKPANIVRASDGRYVLVDLGIARHVDLSDITAMGSIPGTQGYMSPEQARGRRSLTIHSDVFSLGVTLYELAAKEHPYQRVQANIPRMSPRDLDIFRPDLSASFKRLVHEMMTPSSARRPEDPARRFGLPEVF